MTSFESGISNWLGGVGGYSSHQTCNGFWASASTETNMAVWLLIVGILTLSQIQGYSLFFNQQNFIGNVMQSSCYHPNHEVSAWDPVAGSAHKSLQIATVMGFARSGNIYPSSQTHKLDAIPRHNCRPTRTAVTILNHNAVRTRFVESIYCI